MLLKESLLRIIPFAKDRVDIFIDPINCAMNEFDINSPLRISSFIAQIAHESGQFKYLKELASGIEYEGRSDLGNTQPNDGRRFKGRGLIQITGRANYVAVMMNLNIDCVENPELLEEPINACRSAAWFWKSHGLNELADLDNQKLITKRINGGLNGFNERMKYLEIAKKELMNGLD